MMFEISEGQHLLSLSRRLLHETELDKEFLAGCFSDGFPNFDNHADRYIENSNQRYFTKTESITSDGYRDYHANQTMGQFQTNYDNVTGETNVKLGIYDYPIDITDAKSLQEIRSFSDENDASLEALLCSVNEEACSEPLPYCNPSSFCKRRRSNSSDVFTEYLQVESRTNTEMSSKDEVSQLDTQKKRPMLTLTPLQSGTEMCQLNPTMNLPSYLDLDCQNKNVVSKPECLPALNLLISPHKRLNDPNVFLNNTPDLSNAHFNGDAITLATNNESMESVVKITDVKRSRLYPSNIPLTSSNSSVRRSFHSSSITSSLTPSSTSSVDRLKSPVINHDQSNEVLRCHSNNHVTMKQTVCKHRTFGKSSRYLHKSRETPNKEEEQLKIPYSHELLMTSTTIWGCHGGKHKKKLTRGCKLWEFIRNLLLSPETNPCLIKWEDRTAGTFKLVQSKVIANMWGMKKGNGDMTYEKLSRAMRYYYKKQVFQPVIGKRLIYKFGPKATGWRDEKARGCHDR